LSLRSLDYGKRWQQQAMRRAYLPIEYSMSVWFIEVL
jgi:hypothetical protein